MEFIFVWVRFFILVRLYIYVLGAPTYCVGEASGKGSVFLPLRMEKHHHIPGRYASGIYIFAALCYSKKNIAFDGKIIVLLLLCLLLCN